MMILGMNWLKKANPKINWVTHSLEIASFESISACIHREAHKDKVKPNIKTLVPKEYHALLEVVMVAFSVLLTGLSSYAPSGQTNCTVAIWTLYVQW